MNNEDLIQILEAVGATDRDGIDCEDVLGMNWFDARDKALAALSAKPTLHWSDCATSNRGTPELLGPCDCGWYTPEPAIPAFGCQHPSRCYCPTDEAKMKCELGVGLSLHKPEPCVECKATGRLVAYPDDFVCGYCHGSGRKDGEPAKPAESVDEQVSGAFTFKLPYRLSRDYSKLYELADSGHRLVGFVDHKFTDDQEISFRDVVGIHKHGDSIGLGVRGIGYGEVSDWMATFHKMEKPVLFRRLCEQVNLEWIEGSTLTAAHAAALAKVKQEYETYGVQLKEALERTYDCDMAVHKEQGRREALHEAINELREREIYLKDNKDRTEVENGRIIGLQDAVQYLVESARAAQQEETK